MSKQKPWQKWVLPTVIDPPRICFKIEVPNERYHIGAFMGALQALGSGFNWADDPEHKARQVAAVWRDCIDKSTWTECKPKTPIDTGGLEIDDGMQIRISPDDPCIIQCLDCNGNWADWYDPRGCIPGGLAQPSDATPPAEGECLEYDVILGAYNQWQLPVPVGAGDTVEITQAGGAWGDGSGLWYCPSGQRFILGVCGGSTITDGGDPCPDLPHASLIAIEEDGSICHSAYTGKFTVQAMGPTTLTFQQNDASPAGNPGSISFHVRYCKALSDCWILDIEMDVNDGGFIQNPSVNDPSGVWVAGHGWRFTDQAVATTSDFSRAVRIRRNLGGTFHVTRIDMTYDLTRGTHVPDGDQATGIGVVGHNVNFPTSNGTNLHNNGTGLAIDIDHIDLTVYADYNTGSSALDGDCGIVALHVEGTGPRPVDAVGC